MCSSVKWNYFREALFGMFCVYVRCGWECVCIFSPLMRSFYLWTTFCGEYRILSHIFPIWTHRRSSISRLHLHLHRIITHLRRFLRERDEGYKDKGERWKIYQFTSHIVNEKPKVHYCMFTHTLARKSEMKRTHKFCYFVAIRKLKSNIFIKTTSKTRQKGNKVEIAIV